MAITVYNKVKCYINLRFYNKVIISSCYILACTSGNVSFCYNTSAELNLNFALIKCTIYCLDVIHVNYAVITTDLSFVIKSEIKYIFLWKVLVWMSFPVQRLYVTIRK